MMFNQMTSVLKETGVKSISGCQIGYNYQCFAMEAVFLNDFTTNQNDFEKIFLKNPESDSEMLWQHENMEAYIQQIESEINRDKEMNYFEQEIAIIEKIKQELSMMQNNSDNDSNNNNDNDNDQNILQNQNETLNKYRDSNIVIVINPSWEPLGSSLCCGFLFFLCVCVCVCV